MTELSRLPVAERIARFIDTYQWLRRAAQERILSRRSMNLQAVHPFADALTIVDISTPDFWRIRLSGTKACERSGRDQTGCDARQSFDENERSLRHALAHSLFESPCGIRAVTRETYANGAQALLDTIAMPLTGTNDQRLVVHYAQVIEDIDHAYRARPMAEKTGLVSYDYVDLGFGIPAVDTTRRSA